MSRFSRFSAASSLAITILAILLTSTLKTADAACVPPAGRIQIQREAVMSDPYITCSALPPVSSEEEQTDVIDTSEAHFALDLCASAFSASHLNAGCYCVGPYQPVYCPNTPNNPSLLDEYPEMAGCRSACTCVGEKEAVASRTEQQAAAGETGKVGGVDGWRDL